MSRLTLAGISFIVAVSLAACAAETNYKVLSFFFDGVPKPEEKKTAGEKKTSEGTAEIAQKFAPTVHAPYAARMCDACHNPSTHALVLPIQELCFKCHQFKMDKKYVHGPLASGGCRVCHDPHSSGYRFLLVSESERFCFYCHDEKAIARNEAHKGHDMKCTTCHNPHMSDKEHLLR